jgi:hypothetical protein
VKDAATKRRLQSKLSAQTSNHKIETIPDIKIGADNKGVKVKVNAKSKSSGSSDSKWDSSQSSRGIKLENASKRLESNGGEHHIDVMSSSVCTTHERTESNEYSSVLPKHVLLSASFN